MITEPEYQRERLEFGDDCRRRWLVLPSWNRLHRVKSIRWYDEMISGVGWTVCGQWGHMQMPGVLSRFGLPRCAHCCRMTGTTQGHGNPENTNSEQCPACGGDGRETCDNPDHGFIAAVGGEIGRLGCPCCGHDPDHKMSGPCPECSGTGLINAQENPNG